MLGGWCCCGWVGGVAGGLSVFFLAAEGEVTDVYRFFFVVVVVVAVAAAAARFVGLQRLVFINVLAAIWLRMFATIHGRG